MSPQRLLLQPGTSSEHQRAARDLDARDTVRPQAHTDWEGGDWSPGGRQHALLKPAAKRPSRLSCTGSRALGAAAAWPNDRGTAGRGGRVCAWRCHKTRTRDRVVWLPTASGAACPPPPSCPKLKPRRQHRNTPHSAPMTGTAGSFPWGRLQDFQLLRQQITKAGEGTGRVAPRVRSPPATRPATGGADRHRTQVRLTILTEGTVSRVDA